MKITSKCGNCNFQFKKQKPGIVVEPETVFTIFATEVAHSVAAGGETAVEMNSMAFEDSEDTAMYDAPSLDYPDKDYENTGDFELDLSDAEDYDQEMVLGATITEDLSEIDDGDLEDSNMGLREIEVEGLGFNSDGSSNVLEQDTDSEENLATEEAGEAELDEFDSTEAEIEESDSSLESEPDSASDETGISLETDLNLDDLEDENTPQADADIDLAVDMDDGEFELDPDLKLEELDLALNEENDAIDAAAEEDEAELTVEDLELEMEALEDETPPASSEEDPKKNQ